MTPDEFPICNVLFCDDIRREETGKLIVIGVYTGGISTVFPSTSPLSYLVQVSGLDIGHHSLDFVIEAPGGYRVDFNGGVEIVNPEAPVFISLQGAPMQYKEAGRLSFQLIFNGEQKEIAHLMIEGQTPSTKPEDAEAF